MDEVLDDQGMYDVRLYWQVQFPEDFGELNQSNHGTSVVIPLLVPVEMIDEEEEIRKVAATYLNRFVFDQLRGKRKLLTCQKYHETTAKLMTITVHEVEDDNGLAPIPLRKWMEDWLNATTYPCEQ